jgi:hypothetical protein
MAIDVREIYDRYIRSLAPEERRELLELVERDLRAGDTAPRGSIVELHGLGKEIWQDIEAQQYVSDLRSGSGPE